MRDSRDPKLGFNSFASAFDVVSRVGAAVGVMVVPGLLGQWLDRKWGTGYLALLGFLLGIPCGIYYLMEVSGALPYRRGRSSQKNKTSDSSSRDNVSEPPPEE